MRAEAAAQRDGAAAAAAFDVSAFFEMVDWQLLRSRAMQEGFPLPILRMAMALYAAPRFVGADGVVDVGRYPSRGIAPGCPWAMTFAKLYVLDSFRRITAANPSVHLSVFVDDIVVSAEADDKSTVRRMLVDASADVRDAIGSDLRAEMAEEKSVVVASDPKLARQVCRDLQLPESAATAAAVFWGGEVSMGKRRRLWASKAGRRFRLRQMEARLPRVRAFRAAAGSATARLARTGLVPAAAHAVEIFGLSDRELLRAQRIAAAAQTPSAQGRSLTALRFVKEDPSEKAAIAPLLRWARECWEAVCGSPRAITLPQLRALWLQGKPGRALLWRRWGEVTGP